MVIHAPSTFDYALGQSRTQKTIKALTQRTQRKPGETEKIFEKNNMFFKLFSVFSVPSVSSAIPIKPGRKNAPSLGRPG
jgi:hypothetical protein